MTIGGQPLDLIFEREGVEHIVMLLGILDTLMNADVSVGLLIAQAEVLSKELDEHDDVFYFCGYHTIDSFFDFTPQR